MVRIFISLHGVCSDEGWNDAAVETGLHSKLLITIQALHKFILFHQIRQFAVFHLTDICHAVTSLDDDVNLRVVSSPLSFTAPRVVLSPDGIDVQYIFDLLNVFETNPFKRQAKPCVDDGRVHIFTPKPGVARSVLDKLKVKDAKQVSQLVQASS